MTEIETKNALIESTMLGKEDHGMMSFFLHLIYGDSGQGAGGIRLDQWNKEKNCNEGTAYGMSLIMRIMEVVGVDKWEDLKGKHIRVKCSWAKVHAIGNLLKDDWIDFDEFGKQLLNKTT